MLKLSLTVSEGQMHRFILRAQERGKQLEETSKMISLSNAMTAKGAGLLFFKELNAIMLNGRTSIGTGIFE